MALKDTLTEPEHTALPETDRGLYLKREADGVVSFNLNPNIVTERTALTTKNGQLLTEKQKAAADLKVYQDLGIDPVKIKELVAAHEASEAAKLTEAERKTAAEAAIKTAHKAEMDRIQVERTARESFLTRELRRNMIEAVAQIAIEKAGVVEGGAEALLPHIVAQMEMVEDGEGDSKRMVTRIVDGSKAHRYVGSDFMEAAELVEEYKKRPGFGGLFKAAGVGGGGAGQQAKGAGAPGGITIKRLAFDLLSPEAKSAHLKAGGTVVD